MLRILSCLMISFLTGSCSFFNGSSNMHVERAAYIWELTEYGYRDTAMKTLQLDRIYVHFADIGWNEVYGAHPIAKNYAAGNDRHSNDGPREIPVIYFVNDVFAKLDEDAVYDLIYKVKGLLNQRYNDLTEVQIDCDWTESTRDRYFHFLRELKSRMSETIFSATLRLHQYKYREKSGIPPVDYVMLMLYHTGKTAQIGNQNSIFDREEAEKYLKGCEPYPLPLHAAVPYFSWIKLSSNGKFKHLIRADILPSPDSNTILRRIADHTYELLRDTVVDESYLRIGDQLLFESITLEETMQAVQIAREAFNTDTSIVAVFDLKSMSNNPDQLAKFNTVYHEAE